MLERADSFEVYIEDDFLEDPCRALLTAILRQSIVDLHLSEFAKVAYQWFLSNERGGELFSFLDITESLGINPKPIRQYAIKRFREVRLGSVVQLIGRRVVRAPSIASNL